MAHVLALNYNLGSITSQISEFYDLLLVQILSSYTAILCHPSVAEIAFIILGWRLVFTNNFVSITFQFLKNECPRRYNPMKPFIQPEKGSKVTEILRAF